MKDLNNGKTSSVYRLEDLTLLRWQYSQNLSADSKQLYSEISAYILQKLQADFEIHMKLQGTQNTQNSLNKEEHGQKIYTS